MILNNNNLGGADAKEYADISAYRNILEIINNMEVAINEWGKGLYNDAIILNERSWIQVFPPAQIAIGYAVPIVGVVGRKGNKSPLILLQKKLDANGFKYDKINPKVKKVKGASKGNMVAFGRLLSLEMNRVRLPLTLNFRQIIDKISTSFTRFGRWDSVKDYDTGIVARTLRINGESYIQLIESLDLYTVMKSTIATLRKNVRREIDAANLAKKVQEETLRREEEELIERRRVDALAEERRIQILEEKKLTYETELAEAKDLTDELAQTRLDLESELALVRDAAQTATLSESDKLQNEAGDLLLAIDEVNQVESDSVSRIASTIKAKKSLDSEINRIVQYEEFLLPPSLSKASPKKGAETAQGKSSNLVAKKTPIAPLLLTIATGIILS